MQKSFHYTYESLTADHLDSLPKRFHDAGVCVSTIIDLAQDTPQKKQELMIKSALSEVRRQIEQADLGEDVQKALLSNLEDFSPSEDDLQSNPKSLALYMSQDQTMLLGSDLPLQTATIISPRPYMLPLMEALEHPSTFHLMTVSQQRLELWEGTSSDMTLRLARSIEEIEFSEAAEYVDNSDQPLGAHSANRGAPGGAIFHGYASNKEAHDEDRIRRFYKTAASQLLEIRRSEGSSDVPLILAGEHIQRRDFIEQLCSAGGSAIDERHQLDRLDGKSVAAIRDQIFSMISTEHSDLPRLNERWESFQSRNQTLTDIIAIARNAAGGMIDELMVSNASALWGHFDATMGKIDSSASSEGLDGYEYVELRDAISALVREHGGRVHVLPEEDMPKQGAAMCAILRGPRLN